MIKKSIVGKCDEKRFLSQISDFFTSIYVFELFILGINRLYMLVITI